MDYGEQMELDITLESDRTLKDNIQEVARFVQNQFVASAHPDPTKNRHEGYGVIAEAHSGLQKSTKAVDTEMKSILNLLPNGEGTFIQLCGSVYNAAVDTAMSAIKLAADAKRVLEDLYSLADEKTPIEEAIENADDGFEEAEAADQENEEEE